MTRSPIRRLLFSIVRRVLYFWVRSETISQSAFNLKLDRSKPVFYVLQRASLSDLAVLDHECGKTGLPRPVAEVAVGNHIEPAAFIFLNPAASWFGRRTRVVPPAALVRLVGALEQNAVDNAQIVPVSVFWGQSPDRETSPWKLLFADSWAVTGRLRKLLSILILGRKTRVQFSAPIQLSELVAQNKGHERTLRMAHRMLRVHFRNQKTAVIGPDLSHRRNLVKGLVHAPQVRQAIREEAERENISIEKAEAKALRYGNEIASDYAYTAVRFLEVVLSWFWNKIYDGIRVNHIEQIQDSVQGHEVIYVPCHRSHIDYLLLSYLLFRNGLTPPHIAAGINLNMPVIGSLLRRGGAFFMRRSFKGNPLYTSVFNEYLHTLFSRGFPVEYFVEGGRSRTGRMLQPKTGMLAITLRSYLRSPRLPILFVPVYIGYERVLEGRTYLGELRGAQKKKESIFDIFKVIGALKQRFGQVWVNFGEPLRLNEFLDGEQPGWRQQNLAPSYRPEWLSDTTNRLAERIAQKLNEAAAVNPVNLVALAMLSTSRQALDQRSLARILDLYQSLLRAVPYSPHTTLPDGNGEALIDYVKALGLLAEQKDALGNILYLDEQNAVLMTYYRNNVMHIFALADQPRTDPALHPGAVSLPAGRAVHALGAGRAGDSDRPVAGGLRRTGPAQARWRDLCAPGAQLAAVRAADAAGAGHRADATALLHGDLAAAQQRPAQPHCRGAGNALHGDGPAAVDPAWPERAGVLRQEPVPPFHQEPAGRRRAASGRSRQARPPRQAR